MKLNHFTIVLAILAMLGFAACGEESGTQETPAVESSPAAEESTEEATAEAAPAEQPAARAEQPAAPAEPQGGGSVCERAVACCEAYVSAVSATTPGVTVETACAGVRQAGSVPGGEATCTSAIEGWRQSLTALHQAVPAPCAE
ncbi:MAG TPA: hypothetical protein VIL20_01970 [Sandaracinaceae bacterium]